MGKKIRKKEYQAKSENTRYSDRIHSKKGTGTGTWDNLINKKKQKQQKALQETKEIKEIKLRNEKLNKKDSIQDKNTVSKKEKPSQKKIARSHQKQLVEQENKEIEKGSNDVPANSVKDQKNVYGQLKEVKSGELATLEEGIENKKKKRKKTTPLWKKTSVDGVALGIEKSNELVESSLQNAEDNVSVATFQKASSTQKNIIRKIRMSKLQRDRRSRLKEKKKDKLHQKETKAEYKSALKNEKLNEDYKKSSVRKKMQKRRQMKKKIYEKQGVPTFKQKVLEFIKSPISYGLNRVKYFGIAAIIIGMIFYYGANFWNNIIFTGFNAITGSVSTTYLSTPSNLSEMEQMFKNLEQELQNELDDVQNTHRGYDEYIIRKSDDIGHSTHELLSYLTAKHGQIDDPSEIQMELKQLIHSMYRITYSEEKETRYRRVEKETTDKKGNKKTEVVQEPYTYKKLIITLYKREFDKVARENLSNNQIKHYESLLECKGNMADIFGQGTGEYEILKNPIYENPGIEYDDQTVKKLFTEAEKHIGKPYVFGSNGPNTFDCSSFVCWSFTHSGVKKMPRTSAYYIFKEYCYPIAPSEAKAGDIIFFGGTYTSGTPISHVGIYAGNGMMLHAGEPVQYTSINTKYWKEHFYTFGRVKK